MALAINAVQLGCDTIILINQSGRADKDIFTVADAIEDKDWKEFIKQKAAEYES